MKKPFCETSKEVLQHIDPTKKVRVYRNLHKKCVSVKQGGIVQCHATNVVLNDCKFIVNEAGQARVRREGKKYVHAFIEGYVVSASKSLELLDFGIFQPHQLFELRDLLLEDVDRLPQIVDLLLLLDEKLLVDVGLERCL